MNTFKDIEEALAAQVIEQTKVFNDNNHKGDPLKFAEECTHPDFYILKKAHENIHKLKEAKDPDEAKAAALNVLNYTLFYMINHGLL